MKILIADDHSLIRSGLSNLLAKHYPNAEIETAESATSALDAAKRVEKFDFAMLDLFMQDMDGFTFLREFSSTHSNTPVIVMSGSTNRSHVRRAFDFGALAYLPKTIDEPLFLNAIEKVLSGGVFVPSDEQLLGDSFSSRFASSEGRVYTASQARESLTQRQLEILERLREGKGNKYIARELGLSENTVKSHVSAILRTLGLGNRTEAGIFAEKLGI